MFTKQSTRRNITLIIAFAVFWVFLGGLLNFHANRILGTELTDHAYPAIKPKTKENTFQVSDITKAANHLDFFTLTNNFDLSNLLLPTALVKKQEIAVAIVLEVRPYQFGLRAPPSL
ncbi:MAG: hypothetical protein KKG99_02690 [Bacteroidetes bacterium]|nr:hypothetical protein [Bacteroidota bacterium]